ncbi:MAG: hypothetical protein ABIA76_03195 [Candidatus Diapherotrites archaeon]
MHDKGQVFSLDLMIAAGLIFLAMAIIINSVELDVFTTKNNFELSELQYVGLTASDRFVSMANPCQEQNINVLNCVDFLGCDIGTIITKEKLGIADEFDYAVESDYSSCFQGTEDAPDDKAVFAVKRTVLINSVSENQEKFIFKIWRKEK